jgi:transcriptional regulator with XRE-family HTH domain
MPLRKKRNCLREIRIQNGLSGYDLQILSNIPAQEIYRIERGLKRPMPYEKALISKALGLREEEIFPDELKHNNKIEGLKSLGDSFHERLAQA